MGGSPQVAIIGAGPYGLSIATHLRARGIGFHIFGSPMQSWRARMPMGMFLKSEGFASNLYDPGGHFTLRQFCAQYGFAYGDMGVPISLETMTAYGLSFQKQLVPDLQDRTVVALDRSPDGFRLRMDDGDVVAVSQVVVAVGGNYFQYVPSTLAHLPAEFLSHSSEHCELNRFKGHDVTVIGGGASAVDLAALLHEIGAEVRLVARQPSITFVFFGSAKPRSLWQRVRYPMSGIGAGWRSRFFTDAPMLFRHLPQDIRLRTVRTYLGPAGAALMKDRIIGRVPLLLVRAPRRAEIRRGRNRPRHRGNRLQGRPPAADLPKRGDPLPSTVRRKCAHTVARLPVLGPWALFRGLGVGKLFWAGHALHVRCRLYRTPDLKTSQP